MHKWLDWIKLAQYVHKPLSLDDLAAPLELLPETKEAQKLLSSSTSPPTLSFSDAGISEAVTPITTLKNEVSENQKTELISNTIKTEAPELGIPLRKKVSTLKFRNKNSDKKKDEKKIEEESFDSSQEVQDEESLHGLEKENSCIENQKDESMVESPEKNIPKKIYKVKSPEIQKKIGKIGPGKESTGKGGPHRSPLEKTSQKGNNETNSPGKASPSTKGLRKESPKKGMEKSPRKESPGSKTKKESLETKSPGKRRPSGTKESFGKESPEVQKRKATDFKETPTKKSRK
eukprot:TRINITY_DN1854_c0_g2_i1.p1 TRINITY_DN1854_c0_g2~~TRINITY_DN1854_c0_g2_i1.p1  ORF type:complete len:290 (+),score=74.77 TRINITY_DN1854_c0_g2_i1:424-1293(+)